MKMCSDCKKLQAYCRGYCKPCYQRQRDKGFAPTYTGPIRCGDQTDRMGFVWGEHESGGIEMYVFMDTGDTRIDVIIESNLRRSNVYRPNKVGQLVRPATEQSRKTDA